MAQIYQCTRCPKQLCASAMANHVATHHAPLGEVPFYCGVCKHKARYHRQRDLIKHLKEKHSGQEPAVLSKGTLRPYPLKSEDATMLLANDTKQSTSAKATIQTDGTAGSLGGPSVAVALKGNGRKRSREPEDDEVELVVDDRSLETMMTEIELPPLLSPLSVNGAQGAGKPPRGSPRVKLDQRHGELAEQLRDTPTHSAHYLAAELQHLHYSNKKLERVNVALTTEVAVLSQQAKDLVQGSQQLLEGFQAAAQQMSSVGDKLTTATSHLLTVTNHLSSLVVSMEKRLEQFSTCSQSRGSSPCPSCYSSRSSSRSTSRSPSPATPSTTQDDRNQLQPSESSARSPSAPSLPDKKPEAQPKVQHRPCDQVQDAQETPSGNRCGTSGIPTRPTTPPKDPSQPPKVTHEGPHVSFRTRNQTPEHRHSRSRSPSRLEHRRTWATKSAGGAEMPAHSSFSHSHMLSSYEESGWRKPSHSITHHDHHRNRPYSRHRRSYNPDYRRGNRHTPCSPDRGAHAFFKHLAREGLQSRDRTRWSSGGHRNY